jgi:hypothetical protein
MTAMGILMMLFGRQITDVFVAARRPRRWWTSGVSCSSSLPSRFRGSPSACAWGIAGVRVTQGCCSSSWQDQRGSCGWSRHIFAITLGMGVPGAWLAAIMDINFRSLLMYLRFRQKWKEIAV